MKWIFLRSKKSIHVKNERSASQNEYWDDIRGNLTDAILTVDYWRITHFKAAISRIIRCTFVNIITTYLYVYIEKWPTSLSPHTQEISNALKYTILKKKKKTSVLNLLGVRYFLCRYLFNKETANYHVYKCKLADSWYPWVKVINSPKTDFQDCVWEVPAYVLSYREFSESNCELLYEGRLLRKLFFREGRQVTILYRFFVDFVSFIFFNARSW